MLLTFALLAGGCASPSSSSVPPAPSGPSASPVASIKGVPPTGQQGSGTLVTCSLPAQVCGDTLRAVEALPALDARGMPPLAVEIVDMSECRTVSGAPKGYDPCAAAINPPAEPSAIGGADALASVTYRNGLGRAFLYVWWRTFPSGRGPVNTVLEAHNP